MRMKDNYPLTGKQTKLVLDNYATVMYLSVNKPKEYDKWIDLPNNKELNECIDKLLQWSGINEFIKKDTEEENNETEE